MIFGEVSALLNNRISYPIALLWFAFSDMTTISGDTDTEDYLHDMELCVWFAKKSREQIAADIMCAMGLTYPIESYWHTIHNYIEVFADGSYVIRKGAIRANRDERVLIPLNMAAGSVIGTGKGNSDWNYSAPHGAGRNFSRNHAYKTQHCQDDIDRALMV